MSDFINISDFDEYSVNIDDDYLHQDYDDAELEYFSTLDTNTEEETDIQFE